MRNLDQAGEQSQAKIIVCSKMETPQKDLEQLLAKHLFILEEPAHGFLLGRFSESYSK